MSKEFKLTLEFTEEDGKFIKKISQICQCTPKELVTTLFLNVFEKFMGELNEKAKQGEGRVTK